VAETTAPVRPNTLETGALDNLLLNVLQSVDDKYPLWVAEDLSIDPVKALADNDNVSGDVPEAVRFDPHDAPS
jgi:hypothetical protein